MPVSEVAPQWEITIRVPMRLGDGMLHELGDRVAEAAYRWEPADRDGWDVCMFGQAVDHAADAALDAARGRIQNALALIDTYAAVFGNALMLQRIRAVLTGSATSGYTEDPHPVHGQG
jgi:hypothetical protein